MNPRPITNHIDTMARAVATLDMWFITAPVIIGFCEKRGILEGEEDARVTQLRVFIDAFMVRHPVWAHDEKGRGLSYQPDKASRHARLAWMALCARVLEEEHKP